MKTKRSKSQWTVENEQTVEIELKWANCASELHSLIRNGSPEAHAVSLLSIATTATAALQRIAISNPGVVRHLARDRSQWPCMVSPFKNDRHHGELTRKIELGKNILKTGSKSNLESVAAMQAVDILEAANRKKENAEAWERYRARDKAVGERYKRIHELPPLSRESFRLWYATILKDLFDAQWPRIKNLSVWRKAMQNAKGRLANGRAVGNETEYATEYALQNYARKKVMDAIKGFIS